MGVGDGMELIFLSFFLLTDSGWMENLLHFSSLGGFAGLFHSKSTYFLVGGYLWMDGWMGMLYILTYRATDLPNAVTTLPYPTHLPT